PSCGLKHGIYAVRVEVAGKRHDGVASFGRRPMFDDGAPLLEVFLFDFNGDLYGQTVDVAFIGWIRHEQKFDSIEVLKRHMTSAAARRGAGLRRLEKLSPWRVNFNPAALLNSPPCRSPSATIPKRCSCRRPNSPCARACRSASRKSWRAGKRAISTSNCAPAQMAVTNSSCMTARPTPMAISILGTRSIRS